MPIYEYSCPKCGHIFEEWVKKYDPNTTAQCPKCKTQAEHIVSHTSFVLKGTGWYVTDYKNRNQTDTGAVTEKASSEPTVQKTESKPVAPTGTD